MGVDETRLEDFDLIRLQAQYDDLVQSARLESVLEFDVKHPNVAPSIRPRRAPVQRRPARVCRRGHDRRGKIGFEVACDDAHTGSRRRPASTLHPKHTPELRVERGIEVDVEET